MCCFGGQKQNLLLLSLQVHLVYSFTLYAVADAFYVGPHCCCNCDPVNATRFATAVAPAAVVVVSAVCSFCQSASQPFAATYYVHTHLSPDFSERKLFLLSLSSLPQQHHHRRPAHPEAIQRSWERKRRMTQKAQKRGRQERWNGTESFGKIKNLHNGLTSRLDCGQAHDVSSFILFLLYFLVPDHNV